MPRRRPEPPAGEVRYEWTGRQLCKVVGISLDQLHRWVRAGYLPPAQGKARATRYGRIHVDQARVLAGAAGKRSFLSALAKLQKVQAAQDAQKQAEQAEAAERDKVPCWHRWTLAPGIELHVVQGANPVTWALAQALIAHTATLLPPPKG